METEDSSGLSALLIDSLKGVTDVSGVHLSRETSLVAVGLDSLRFSELVMEVEKRAEVQFPEEWLLRCAQSTTLGDVELLIQEHLSSQLGTGTAGKDLFSVFKTALRSDADRCITRLEERGGASTDLSLGMIADAAAGYAKAFGERGVGKGDRVLLLLPTCAEFLFAFWGCQAIGAVPVPVYPPSPGRRLQSGVDRLVGVMERSRPAVLVTQPAIADLLRGREIPMPGLVMEPLSGVDRNFLLNECTGPSPDDVALIQFTSGSTLSPRGCVLTHRAVCANVDAVLERLGAVSNDVGVSWLPLYHDMGLMGGVLAPVFAGAKVVLASPDRFVMDPTWWLDAIQRHRGTLTAAPNFAFALVLKKLAGSSTQYDLSSVRKIVNGAEPIDANLIRQFIQRFSSCGLSPDAIEPAWGLAENTVFVTSASGVRTDRIDRDALELQRQAIPPTTDSGVCEIVCLGRPFPGTDLRVIGADGQVQPERRVGEVEVRSPSLMSGYFEDSESSSVTLRDGWLRTGDLGYLSDGELYLVGRSKDLIIVGGRNIAPQDVERAVAVVEGVREGSVVAIGCPSKSGTEELVVVAELSPGHAASVCALEIKQACSEQLSIIPQTVQIVSPGTIPKTSSGKLQRGATRQMFIHGKMADHLVVDRSVGVTR